jgi:hypothetical protein
VEISAAEVEAHFARKPPPSKETIDQVKVKCTMRALKRPPPSPPQSNYESIIERTYKEAQRSGSTCSAAREAK